MFHVKGWQGCHLHYYDVCPKKCVEITDCGGYPLLVAKMIQISNFEYRIESEQNTSSFPNSRVIQLDPKSLQMINIERACPLPQPVGKD